MGCCASKLPMRGSWALVTGASAGIGMEIARVLARGGVNLVLVARRRDALVAFADSLKKEYHVSVHVMAYDLGKSGAPADLFAEVTKKEIHISYLVNNAGFGLCGKLVDLDASKMIEMISLNCSALVHLTALFLPAMLARKSGRILNISSTAGFQPGPGMAVYFATKAFVTNFSEAVNFENRGTGVTCTAYCPGATASEFAAVAGNDKSLLFRGHVARSEDVAAAAVQSMLRGTSVAIHGGLNNFLKVAGAWTPRYASLWIAERLNSTSG